MQFILTLFGELRRLVQTFFREMRFVFSFAPGLSLVLTIFQIFIGILPAAQLIFAAKIVDVLVGTIGTGVFPDQLIVLIVIELILIGAERFIHSINDYFTNHFRGLIQLQVNDRIHKKVIGLDLPTIEKASTHTTITFLKDQSWRPSQMVFVLFNTIGNTLASISFVGIAFSFFPIITVIFVFSILPSLALSVRAMYQGMQLAWNKASLMKSVWYFESFFKQRTFLIELIVHNIGQHFAQRYRNALGSVVEIEKGIEKKRVIAQLFTNMFAFAVFVFTYVNVVFGAVIGVLTIGQFTLLAGAFNSLERFMVAQVWQIAALLEHTKYLDAFRELEKLDPKIVDHKGAKKLKGDLDIEFKNVSFSYPGQKKTISNVSFRMYPGERVALVGENGAGKSTLVKLLLRLYEPTSGEIFINGRNYKEYSLASLRKAIGVTFQDFLRYSVTARENIGLGRLEYIERKKSIETAARSAGIHKRIKEMPKAYETQLGHELSDEGVDLSGGEWQKLALARSLIKDASLLILDEPTAALDARSEYKFFKTLFSKVKNQSLLLISHRFSSVRIADKIVVLKNGKMIESGTHEQLLQQDRLYKDLYEIQTGDL
jgi:ATP-binding cassette, subfamily B, bacterial